MNRWTVAITGMNARPENPGPGFAVARCLREAGDFGGRLIGLGYDVLDAALYDRDLNGAYLLPYPSSGEEALLARLLEIHAQERLDAVIPCLDSELQSFIQIAPRLREHGIRTMLPDKATLQSRNKDRLPALCKRLSIAHPETKAITDVGHFRTLSESSFPLVVKGPFYDAAVVHTAAAAEYEFRRLVQAWGYPVLVQQFHEGQEINLAGVGDGRRLLGAVTMRKKALTDKGKAWAGVSVIDDQLEQLASRLVEALEWRGPFEAEVLKTTAGELMLIEMNPRFPSWIYLSHGAGRNLPRLLLRLLAGEAVGALAPARPGVMFLRYADELIVDLPEFESLMMTGSLVSVAPSRVSATLQVAKGAAL